MTTEQEETLTIDAVVRSFQAADAQLRRAAEKIEVISQHEANTGRAASSLEASAASVDHLVAQAQEAVRSLQSALDLAGQSLRAGAALLDSAVLTDLQRQVASLDELTRGVDAHVESAEAALSSRLDGVASEITGLRDGANSLAAVTNETSELASRAVRATRRIMLLGVAILALEIVGVALLVMR
ncbi:MAG: hypothetical protein C4558_02395 [Dehalococcoidia bacterium]|nr:MAG: hypothetical protein C4558_02395 [Dehalococcoidia bacterium]